MQKTEKKGIEVLVEFSLKEGTDLKEFESILLPHLERVASEKTCLQMVASKNSENNLSYLLYERWEDEKEFSEVQMKRQYRIPYNEKIKIFEKEERKISIWSCTFFNQKNTHDV